MFNMIAGALIMCIRGAIILLLLAVVYFKKIDSSIAFKIKAFIVGLIVVYVGVVGQVYYYDYVGVND